MWLASGRRRWGGGFDTAPQLGASTFRAPWRWRASSPVTSARPGAWRGSPDHGGGAGRGPAARGRQRRRPRPARRGGRLAEGGGDLDQLASDGAAVELTERRARGPGARPSGACWTSPRRCSASAAGGCARDLDAERDAATSVRLAVATAPARSGPELVGPGSGGGMGSRALGGSRAVDPGGWVLGARDRGGGDGRDLDVAQELGTGVTSSP